MTTTIDRKKDEEGDATLGSLVDTFFDPDIRFNMLKFKHRCVYYMRKLYYTRLFRENCLESCLQVKFCANLQKLYTNFQI